MKGKTRLSENEVLDFLTNVQKIAHPRYRLARYKHIISLINKKHNNTILDLGCGIAPISCMLPRDNKIILMDNLTGRDFYYDGKAKLSASADDYLPEIKNVDLNKRLPISDESVDIVIASEVLEHIVNLNFLLDEIHRVLKKMDCFSVPFQKCAV